MGKRTFIAIEIPLSTPLNAVLDELKGSLSAFPIRWVPAASLHLTLAFIGETTPEMELKIRTVCQQVASGNSAFQLSLSGIGTFGKAAPKVLWLGVREGIEVVTTMAEEIRCNLQSVGIRFEPAVFNAHITVGRFKGEFSADKLVSTIGGMPKYRIQPGYVREITFYQSILEPGKAPFYKPIGLFKLRS